MKDTEKSRSVWPGPLAHHSFMNPEEESQDSNVTRAGHEYKKAKKEARCTGTLIGAKCDDGPAAIYLYSGEGKRRWSPRLEIRFDDFWIKRCSSLGAAQRRV